MKKVLALLIAVMLLSACSDSEATEEQQESEEEPVFTQEDIDLAKEIIAFVQEKEIEFVEEANKELDRTRESYEEFETMTEGFTADKEISEDLQVLSKEMILDPLKEQYGDNLIERDDKELNFRVNVKIDDENGQSLSLEDYEIVPSYENLELEESIIEYHDQHNVHELVFPVDAENTTLFTVENDTNTTVYDEFTFYKSESDDLIIGKMSRLQYNAMISDFEDPEDYHEDSQDLPPLQ